jgi:NitT/TauT family transport system substrate-binding protein
MAGGKRRIMGIASGHKKGGNMGNNMGNNRKHDVGNNKGNLLGGMSAGNGGKPAKTAWLLLVGLLLMAVTFGGCGTQAPAVPDAPAASSVDAKPEVPVEAAPSPEASTEAEASTAPEASAEASADASAASEAETDNPDAVTIRIGGLTGPTSMGMAQIMKNNKDGVSANPYEFTIAGSADELTPKLLQGDLDMLAVPANLASVLHNNSGGQVRLLAVNTLGVIYIVEKGETVQSFTDLKGKTILATGKGSTPEYALRYLLQEHGIDPDKDVTIEWKAEPAEVVALLSKAEGGVAMMPQPFVTIAQGQVEGLRVAVDLTQVWDDLKNGSMMITGVMAVRSDFADAHPEAISRFLDEYRASADFVNANPAEAAAIIDEFGIFKAAVAQKAIPACNITFLEGDGMKTAMQGYLSVLFAQNPKAVGGKLPEDVFYYSR